MRPTKQERENLEKQMLLAVYELSRRSLFVTPTMVSTRMGYDICTRTVSIRKRLENSGLLIQKSQKGDSTVRVTLKLTPEGNRRAKALTPSYKPTPKNIIHCECIQVDGAPFLPADVPPLAAKPNPKRRKLTQKSNVTVSMKAFSDGYKGRRYEDADTRGEDRGGPQPSKTYNRSLTGYSGAAG